MQEMTEGRVRFWTTIFSGFTAVGLVFGGLFAVVQYLGAREEANRTAAIQSATAQFEAKRPFYTRQLELCESAASQAAILAAPGENSPPDLTHARREFWRLYWSPLGIVEDKAVESAMVKFGRCLEKSPGCSITLTNASLELAHACRELISKSWDLQLPAIQGNRGDTAAPSGGR